MHLTKALYRKIVFLLINIFSLVVINTRKIIVRFNLPPLPADFKSLPVSNHGLFKLLNSFEFKSVLDVGSGAGLHADLMHKYGKKVIKLDFGTSIYAKREMNTSAEIESVNCNFYSYEPNFKFDCIWASHVLEHQPNPGLFIQKCRQLLKPGGLLAITVPPLKHQVVGGHLTLWNAGILLYQLVFDGLDCSQASVCSYGYNITIIVRNIERPVEPLTWDSGDIDLLKAYFPSGLNERFDGRLSLINW